MAINLSKGGRINLSKEAAGVEKFRVCLGWNTNSYNGADFDLDVSLFLLNSAEKLAKDENFVFYNNLKSPCGGVVHSGDNRTGSGDGDDEIIFVDSKKLASDVESVAIVVTIYEGATRKQNFGQVRKAYARILDDATSKEIARYDLEEDFSNETAIEVGSFYRKNGEFMFRAVGAGHVKGLESFVKQYAG